MDFTDYSTAPRFEDIQIPRLNLGTPPVMRHITIDHDCGEMYDARYEFADGSILTAEDILAFDFGSGLRFDW